jgi:hypothetical protein
MHIARSSLAVLLLSGCGARSTLDAPDAGGADGDSDADADAGGECAGDGDCVPADCCCPGLPLCVPADEAPDCRDVFCADVVCPVPEPIAACACVDGACTGVPAGRCLTDAQCVIATPLDECCGCPRAYPIGIVAADPCLVRDGETPPLDCGECFSDCAECPVPAGAECQEGECVTEYPRD